MNSPTTTMIVGLANLVIATINQPMWPINLVTGVVCLLCATLIDTNKSQGELK